MFKSKLGSFFKSALFAVASFLSLTKTAHAYDAVTQQAAIRQYQMQRQLPLVQQQVQGAHAQAAKPAPKALVQKSVPTAPVQKISVAPSTPAIAYTLAPVSGNGVSMVFGAAGALACLLRRKKSVAPSSPTPTPSNGPAQPVEPAPVQAKGQPPARKNKKKLKYDRPGAQARIQETRRLRREKIAADHARHATPQRPAKAAVTAAKLTA